MFILFLPEFAVKVAHLAAEGFFLSGIVGGKDS